MKRRSSWPKSPKLPIECADNGSLVVKQCDSICRTWNQRYEEVWVLTKQCTHTQTYQHQPIISPFCERLHKSVGSNYDNLDDSLPCHRGKGIHILPDVEICLLLAFSCCCMMPERHGNFALFKAAVKDASCLPNQRVWLGQRWKEFNSKTIPGRNYKLIGIDPPLTWCRFLGQSDEIDPGRLAERLWKGKRHFKVILPT